MLNVCGCDEILFGDKHKIGAYKYIRQCINENKMPNFHLISIEKIKAKLNEYPNETGFFMSLTQKTINMLDELARHLDEEETVSNAGHRIELSWASNETFSLYLDNLVYLPKLKECEKIFLKLAIYHGQELRQQVESDKFSIADKSSGSTLRLNQTITFDARVKNLNRCAKLCISVHCISKRKKVIFFLILIQFNKRKKNRTLYFFPFL